MQTYQLETAVNSQGIIILPVQFKELYQHQVSLIITDLEPNRQVVKFFTLLTEKYAALNEADLDTAQIYQDRITQNEQENLFA